MYKAKRAPKTWWFMSTHMAPRQTSRIVTVIIFVNYGDIYCIIMPEMIIYAYVWLDRPVMPIGPSKTIDKILNWIGHGLGNWPRGHGRGPDRPILILTPMQDDTSNNRSCVWAQALEWLYKDICNWNRLVYCTLPASACMQMRCMGMGLCGGEPPADMWMWPLGSLSSPPRSPVLLPYMRSVPTSVPSDP